MKLLLLITSLVMSTALIAQNNSREQSIQLTGGYSKTGSGDIPGFIYGAEYTRYIRPNISWSAGFNGFIYDGEDDISSPNYPILRSNSGLRYTTAGVQLTGHLGFSAIKTPIHNFQFRVGPVVKYQSTSLDGYSIIYPIATDYPEPVVTFYNLNPLRTIAAGASVQVLYNYTIKNKIRIGILAGGQTDTEGDLITQLGLTVGRKF